MESSEIELAHPVADGVIVEMRLADMTVEEVAKILAKYASTNDGEIEYDEDREDVSSSTWDFWDGHLYMNKAVVIPGFATVYRQETHGGEGQGDEYWIVLKLVDGNTTKYLRVDGYYQSYDGGYYDGDPAFVNPIERMVTYYE